MSAPSSTPTPPPLLFTLLEGPRAWSELLWFYASHSRIQHPAGAGEQPVLVLPGLGASDHSTVPLRSLLRSLGYRAYGWKLGTNIGPTRRIADGLTARLAELTERHGRAVSVIGQSLGGIMAKDLAVRFPAAVDRLISLGSPVSITSMEQTRAGAAYNLLARHHLPEYAFERWTRQPEPTQPTTSIFSRTDGINHWQACLAPAGPLTENIEVRSSHVGMSFHPVVAYALLDRLVEPLDPWQPFTPAAELARHFPQPPVAAAAAAAAERVYAKAA